jgi:hypothetical protein
MDFADKIRELAARIPKQLEHIQTEEATKTALVMPFINALGYNVFDPTEVVPEFNCDVGTKKGEKVDYAIMRNGKPIMLIECKGRTSDLDPNHASQLFRYFHVTEARFSVLTNGVVYHFFTDLDAPNKMDSKPFLEFDMLNIEERLIAELKKFTKPAFDVDNILNTATELRYTREIKRIMAEQMQEPSPEFTRFFVSQVYAGKMTQAVRDQFTHITKRALQQYVNDQISERLKTALGQEVALAAPAAPTAPTVPASPSAQPMPGTAIPGNGSSEAPKEAGIVTTPEEIEAYQIIKAILRDTISVKRIVLRDAQTYCGIILDDNNRKPICRLHFNRAQKYIGFFDPQKQEERVAIKDLDDIYKHADRLRVTVSAYEKAKTV